MQISRPIIIPEKDYDVILTHHTGGSGYLSCTINTEFSEMVDMLRDKKVPYVLIDLTDDNNIRRYIVCTDVGINETKDKIYFFVPTSIYKLEFAINSDGTYERTMKE